MGYLPFVQSDTPARELTSVEEDIMLPPPDLTALVAHADRLVLLGEDELPEPAEEEDEESLMLPDRPFKLALPGLQSLSYRRSSDQRASSCDNLLVRQSSGCSFDSEGAPRRLQTIDLPL